MWCVLQWADCFAWVLDTCYHVFQGIVKHIDQDERYAAAKWIVSTLSQDRQLYVSSLLELGFEFDADPDMTEFATFIEASMSQCAFMFRDSIPSSSQMNFLQQMQEHQEREENQETKVGKEQSRLVGKIPGVVLFFLRGLEMLQNICGMLEAFGGQHVRIEICRAAWYSDVFIGVGQS